MKRWYGLRNTRTPDDALSERLAASARVWVAWMNAVLDEAALLHPDLPPGPGVRPYRIESVEGTPDQAVLTLSGGPTTHGWMKLMEDDFPAQLHTWLPLWLQLDLELGRRDESGAFPEWIWTRRYPVEQADALREHPLFRPPLTGS